MKVELCQINTVLGDIDKNLKKIEFYIEKAKNDECDMVVFPELALTGYNLRDLVYDVSLDVNDAFLDILKEQSKNIDIVLGYSQNDKNYFFNSALYLSEGKIKLNYKKNYLPDYGMFEEGRYFSSGKSIETVDTKFGRVTILICEDMFHISAQNEALVNSTDILIVLSASPFWSDSRSIKPELWKSVCSNFAQLSGSYLFFNNRAGFEDGVGFFGNSFFLSPFGKIIKEAKMFKEEAIMCDIDLNNLKRAKSFMPVLKNEVNCNDE